jgi:hypothetical protein
VQHSPPIAPAQDLLAGYGLPDDAPEEQLRGVTRVAATVCGVPTAVVNLLDELDLSQMPLVVLNGFGLWAAFTTFALAASVTFDRPGPAIGLSLAYLLINYFLEILGSLWTDVAWSQEYSLLHHFNPGEILTGNLDPIDLAIVFVAALIPFVYALLVFPKRDLAAPA